jgi:chemotaxis protein CheX
MKPANEFLSANDLRQSWVPLLQVATEEVFEIMVGSKLEAAGESQSTPSEITSMVGLAGQLCGVLTLRCGVQTAKLMASKMLGPEAEQADQQMWDAIGEICNMIAGNFKNKLTGLSDHCMLSVPTVITGGDYSFHSLADAGALEITVLFEQQPVRVSLEIHS